MFLKFLQFKNTEYLLATYSSTLVVTIYTPNTLVEGLGPADDKLLQNK